MPSSSLFRKSYWHDPLLYKKYRPFVCVLCWAAIGLISLCLYQSRRISILLLAELIFWNELFFYTLKRDFLLCAMGENIVFPGEKVCLSTERHVADTMSRSAPLFMKT